MAGSSCGYILLLSCFLSLLGRTTCCHPDDSESLVAFKSGITNDTFHYLATWIEDTDCCKWDGIDCDPSTGRVVNLSRPGVYSTEFALNDIWMVGTLSPAIAGLTSLRELNLHSVKLLSGPIPSSLGRLTDIVFLILDDNSFTGPIPDAFSNLRHLELLYLSSNHLSGPIPPSIFSSNVLLELELSRNNLSGPIPETIGNAVGLDSIDIVGNQISGFIPVSIGNLTKLTWLDMSNNRIGGGIPDSISEMVSLQAIFLSDNLITGPIPDSIGRLRNLERLVFPNNRITGRIPDSVGNLWKLVYLLLGNNRITGEIPRSIGNLRKLSELDLAGNELSGRIPFELSKLRNLDLLSLSFNRFNQTSLPSWLSETKSRTIGLAGIGIEGQFPSLLRSLSTTVTTLDLSSNSLTGEIPHWIGNFTGLYSLNLSNNMFESEIPKEFKKNVYIVDLSSNKLSGSIRSVLSRSFNRSSGWENSEIDISNNNFTGGIDDDIGEWPALERLTRFVVSYNPLLEGKIPESLGKLTWLTVVKMAGNGLSGGIPENLLNVDTLVEFDVSDNRLSGRIPAHKDKLGADSFRGNPDLCGEPLLPCKN